MERQPESSPRYARLSVIFSWAEEQNGGYDENDYAVTLPVQEPVTVERLEQQAVTIARAIGQLLTMEGVIPHVQGTEGS